MERFEAPANKTKAVGNSCSPLLFTTVPVFDSNDVLLAVQQCMFRQLGLDECRDHRAIDALDHNGIGSHL